VGGKALGLTMAWLHLDGLGLTESGVRIIDGISLKVGGSRTAILGPNGAGKSTLLRLMHGLLKASGGGLHWPQPLSQGMVFQRPIMLRTTALANVEYGLKLQGVGANERRRRAAAALARVGLPELAARPARRLSGGEQQRVALARAWALDPQVLFLDEPTASLDPASSREVERIIREIAASGTRIVMTTHNLGQARRLAEEVIFIESGRVLEQTPASTFFREPQTAAARRFIQEETP
jgi:tungstate transport system ATP-binding protein